MLAQGLAIAIGALPVVLFILAIVIRPKACRRDSHSAG
jgi:hypothetical protein